MQKVPTVYDVAELAGVSIATVSRVLRKPHEVADATRDRVNAAVLDLGYVPSGSARSLAARRSGAIGLCLPDFDGIDEVSGLAPVEFSDGRVSTVLDLPEDVELGDHLYISEVMLGTEIEAWQHGMAVTIAVARGSRGSEIFDNLAGRVDGIVTLARTIPDKQLAHIARRVPVVVLAGPRSGDEYDHITTDNAEGMRVMTSHVLEAHGVTDLAFVGGPADSPDDDARFRGFCQALRAAGLTAPATPVARGDFTRAQGRSIGRRLLAEGRVPRALVCSNDQTALGVLDALTSAGRRVPEDVIVTGFDGIDASEVSRPRLTTVYQPMRDLGRAAVDTLLHRLRDSQIPPQTRTLPVKVLLRGSCGCLPPESA